MDLIEVKHEFECDSRLQCRACLSVGRKLSSLGRFTNIFMKITAECGHPNLLYTYPVEICWECASLLRKVLQFQEQVKKAYELLLTGESFIHGPLSNLTAITLNDTQHTVYINDNNLQKDSNSRNCSNHRLLQSATEKQLPKSNSNEYENFNNTLSNQHCSTEYNREKKLSGVELSKELKRNDAEATTVFDSGTTLKTNMDNVEKDKCSISIPINSITIPINSISIPINSISVPINSVSIPINSYSVPIENTTIVICDSTKQTRGEDAFIDNSTGDVSEEDYFENDSNTEPAKEISVKMEMHHQKEASIKSKKRSKSRWALKRAELNKKPKFKIVSSNFDDAFTKVQISNEMLEECMMKERDSDYYKSKRFKCETCVLGFDEEKDFIRHTEQLHNKITPSYRCDICKSNISDKRHLSGHIAQHYRIHKCGICEFVCISAEQRLWHFREHRKVFQCLKCDLKFGSRRDFYKHYKEWHEKFICDHCGISFKMRYCIKDHIRKQHSPFTCLPCNKTFARYNGLWLHNKLAHATVSSPAYCVECDTSYKDIYRYKWHLCNSARHTPKKKVRIPCPDCDKAFTKKIYMKDHYNLVHLKLFKYRCEQCDKNFIRNADLVKHRRRTHEGILPAKNKVCCLCGRAFATNKILRNHIRTHTGERPHACRACPARFTQRHALQTHARDNHADEREEAT